MRFTTIPEGSIGSSTYVLHVHRTVTLSKEVTCTIPSFGTKTSEYIERKVANDKTITAKKRTPCLGFLAHDDGGC